MSIDKYKISLQDFRSWYYGHGDPAKNRIIEAELEDPGSEASCLMWLSKPDLANPPPGIAKLPIDKVPQRFEPSSFREELRVIVEAESATSTLAGPRHPDPMAIEASAPRARMGRAVWRRRHQTAIAIAGFGAAAVAIGLLVPLWRGRVKADTVKSVNIAYNYISNINPEVALSSPTPLSSEDRRANIVGLLPDVDHVLAIFDRGAALDGSDLAMLMGKAKALVGRARLEIGLGNDGKAWADLDRAQAIYVSLSPSVDLDVALADVALSRAAILGPRKDYEKALEVLEPIIPPLEAAVESRPDRSDVRLRLARLLNSRANCHRFLAKRLAEKGDGRGGTRRQLQAEADYSHAIDLLQFLFRDGSADEQATEWLSRIYGNRGLLLIDQKATDQAERSMEEAVRIAEDLVRRFPRSLTAQDALIAAVINRGDSRYDAHRLPDAATDYTQSIKLYDNMHNTYPMLRDYTWGQALGRKSLGAVLLDQGKKDEARRILDEARGRYDRLVRLYPNVGDIAAERGELIKILDKIK